MVQPLKKEGWGTFAKKVISLEKHPLQKKGDFLGKASFAKKVISLEQQPLGKRLVS